MCEWWKTVCTVFQLLRVVEDCLYHLTDFPEWWKTVCTPFSFLLNCFWKDWIRSEAEQLADLCGRKGEAKFSSLAPRDFSDVLRLCTLELIQTALSVLFSRGWDTTLLRLQVRRSSSMC